MVDSSFTSLNSVPGESPRFDAAMGERLRLLQRLAHDAPPIVLTTIQALIQPAPAVKGALADL